MAACETAKEAWDTLAKAYAAKVNARRMQLRRQLVLLKKDSRESLAQYVARAVGIKEQLAAAGHNVPETELIWVLMAGLPDVYTPLTTVLENTSEELVLDEVVAKLMTVEQRSLEQHEQKYEEALSAMGSRQQDRRACWKCGQIGHIAAKCLQRKHDVVMAAQQQRFMSAIAL